jgi:hypothetical protein
VKPPSYPTILRYAFDTYIMKSKHRRLDKTIRDWNLAKTSPAGNLSETGDNRPDIKIFSFLIWSLSFTGLRENGKPLCMKQNHSLNLVALMYLHRRYFVEALTKRPSEPLRSTYAMSVLAVHRSATLIIQGILRLSNIVEHVFSNTSFMWTHAL